MGDNVIEEKDNSTKYTSALRKLAFNRIVLAHFFVLFLISFAIGVLFLFLTFSWDSETSESLEKVLKDLGVDEIYSGMMMNHFTADHSKTITVNVENKTFMSTSVHCR